MQISTKVKKWLSLTSAIMLLVMLFFPLGIIEHYDYDIIGGEVIKRYQPEISMGFSAMFFTKASNHVLYRNWAIIIVGLLCWIFFFITAALIAINAVFFKKNYSIINKLTVIQSPVISLLYMIVGILVSAIGGITTLAYIPFIIEIGIAIAYFVLDYKYPDPKEEQTEQNNFSGTISLGTHIICILFIPFWILVWVYRTTCYLNSIPNTEYRNPTNKTLLYMFVPFYKLYWVYVSAKRIDELAKAKGVPSGISTVCMVLSIFLSIAPPIIMQSKINDIENSATNTDLANTQNSNAINEANAAEALKAYKDLLDNGAITQAEYDAKKAEILKL